MKKTAKKITKKQTQEGRNQYQKGYQAGKKAGYDKGREDGLEEAFNAKEDVPDTSPLLTCEKHSIPNYLQAFQPQMALPRWQDYGPSTPLPKVGLYIIDMHDGMTVAGTYFENKFGDGDRRNSSGFVNSWNDVVQPHLIKRVYGPVEL